jgi:hypothetical protein
MTRIDFNNKNLNIYELKKLKNSSGHLIELEPILNNLEEREIINFKGDYKIFIKPDTLYIIINGKKVYLSPNPHLLVNGEKIELNDFSVY